MMTKPIIALDFANQVEIENFLSNFPTDESLFVKVGMELYYQTGPSIIEWLTSLGHDIFLDLKLHDIPNTVEKAMFGLGKLGVFMTNVHAAGGIEMMTAAKRGLLQGSQSASYKEPMLIAVTQLTSTSQEAMQHDQGLSISLEESVLLYAKNTQAAGLDGVVCSAQEAKMIKNATNESFNCICPGIRPAGSDIGDQKRVMTPSMAKANQASYIVVGRPITQVENPYQAYLDIKKEWGNSYE